MEGLTTLIHPSTPLQDDERPSPPSQDDFFQFDMGEDDIFGDEEEEEEEGPGDDPFLGMEEDSSSSGCEADMIMGASVPINIPMDYYSESSSSKRVASVKVGSSNLDPLLSQLCPYKGITWSLTHCSQMNDVAHSMKELMQEFHRDEYDLPRPRIISRSYNPCRFKDS